MKLFKTFTTTLIIALLLTTTISATNLPESREGTIVNAASSAEVIVEATGIFYSDKKFGTKKHIRKYGIDYASKDARKAAVYTLLFSGTDPILSSDTEKQTFSSIQESFFDSNNIKSFITYEETRPSKKVTLKNGKGLKIVKQFKVNRDLLVKSLENQNVLVKRDTLEDLLGNPSIMVIPQTPKGKTPIDILASDENAKTAATVIQSFLTAREYEVTLPDQQSFLNNLSSSQLNIADREEDMAYQLALSIGSDIYIDFSVSHSKAAYDTDKYAVTVRAFETTTGRLLGSETGHSEPRKDEKFVSIEEAMLDAVNSVLSRVTTYWKSDLQKGIQYKVITSIDADSFSEAELEDLQDVYFDTIEDVAKKTKEIIVTSRTIDYLIWCDPKEYDKPRDVWRTIRRQFNSEYPKARITSLNQNRKLLLLKISSK